MKLPRIPIHYRNLLCNFGISFFCFSILLFTTEILARILIKLNHTYLPRLSESFEENPKSMHKFDTLVGWALRPGYQDKEVKINLDGFRSSSEFSIRKSTDGTKPGKTILLLGDSMVFGLGVSQEHIFSEVLNNEHNSGHHYINGGVNGYSTSQEYLQMDALLKIFKPDLIILFFTQGNDILTNPRSDNYYAGFTIRGEELIYKAPSKSNNISFIKRASLFWQFLDHRFLNGKDLTYALYRIDFALRGQNSYPWRVTDAVLSAMAKTVTTHGTQIIVVNIPTNKVKKEETRDKLLRSTCKKLNLPYLDLLSFYPPENQSLFIVNDSHWNSEGHKFIANFVKDAVRQNLEKNQL